MLKNRPDRFFYSRVYPVFYSFSLSDCVGHNAGVDYKFNIVLCYLSVMITIGCFWYRFAYAACIKHSVCEHLSQKNIASVCNSVTVKVTVYNKCICRNAFTVRSIIRIKRGIKFNCTDKFPFLQLPAKCIYYLFFFYRLILSFSSFFTVSFITSFPAALQ